MIAFALAKPGRYEVVWTNPTHAPRAVCSSAGLAVPFSRAVYEEILFALGSREPEVGGLLVGPRNSRIVTHFVLDEAGQPGAASYTLGHEWLNSRLVSYRECGLDVKGIAHSHPSGHPTPSDGDRRYLELLLSKPQNHAAEIYFPIQCDGRLRAYVVTSYSLRVRTNWALPADIQLF